MRDQVLNERFSGVGKYTTAARSMAKKAIPFAGLALPLFAILSISGCTGIASTPKTSSSQQTTPGAATISVAPASISFGSVAVGGTASQSVTITNGGGSNVTVTQASATAAGVTITGISLPLVIAAGKQSTFDVVFSPKAPGALSGNVSVMSDVSGSPSTVSLSGIGMAATAVLTTSASSLSFGNVAVGKNSVLSVILTNAGNSNITVSKIIVSGAPYSTSGVSAGLILTPGQSATLDATFTPAAIGSLTGSMTVASNATNSPATISLSGSGSQTVAPSVALSWTPSTSAVAGYNVYRSEISGGPYTKLDSSIVAMDTYTDSSVQAGLTYYYVVTSVTSAGMESADSTQTSATVPTS
jgi:HYDIN/CFA65/VesB family protein/ASPM-SPD-2-Hydin domain-containing protein